MDEKQDFTRKSIRQKQEEARKKYDEQLHELRQMLDQMASTPSGEKFLKYLFLLCGGDQLPLVSTKELGVSIEETFMRFGMKFIWEQIRINLSSAVVTKIERHNWEQ